MAEEKSYCPYCKVELKKRPTRKSKCKSCENIIYLKKAPGEFIAKLLTTDQYQQVMNAWADQSMSKAKFLLFNQYGMTEDEYCSNIKPYFHSDGKEPTLYEVEWEILKTRIGDEQNYYNLENIYSRMASMQGEVNQDSIELQRLSNLMKLKALKESRYNFVTIHCNPDYCPHAYKLRNYKAAVEDEISNMTIPTLECTRTKHSNETQNYIEYKSCLCSYHPLL